MSVTIIPAHPTHVVAKVKLGALPRPGNRRGKDALGRPLRPSKTPIVRNTHTIKKEIRQWLADMAQAHWFIREPSPGKLEIHFLNQKDAMAYKLAWYGMSVE